MNRGIEESHSVVGRPGKQRCRTSPGLVEDLIRAAQAGNAWFAGRQDSDGRRSPRIDGTFDLIARSGWPWRAGHGQPDGDDFRHPRSVAMVSATAALYRRELFQQIGMFAEEYGSYLEDVDLSLRAAASGFAGLFVPSAICTHQGSASSGMWSRSVVFQLSRNQRLLIRRLFAPELRRAWRWNIAVGQCLWCLLTIRHGRFGSWLRGVTAAREVPIDLNSAQHSRTCRHHHRIGT